MANAVKKAAQGETPAARRNGANKGTVKGREGESSRLPTMSSACGSVTTRAPCPIRVLHTRCCVYTTRGSVRKRAKARSGCVFGMPLSECAGYRAKESLRPQVFNFKQGNRQTIAIQQYEVDPRKHSHRIFFHATDQNPWGF